MTIFFFFLGIMVSSNKCRAGQPINKKGKAITINLILVILWPILLWEGNVQSRLAMYLSVFIIILCTSLGSSLSFAYIHSHVYLNLSFIPPQVHVHVSFSYEPLLRLYALLTAPAFCLMHNEQTLTVGAHKTY